MKHHPLLPRRTNRATTAFTIVEVCITIAVIAVISGIAYVAVGNAFDAAKNAKLSSDVATINSSINLYLASGGSLDGITAPQSIIDKLKTTRSKDSATKFAGAPASSMIDRRTEAVILSGDEDVPGTPRAVWNMAKMRFEIASIGVNGVKEFRLNEEWSDRAIPTETRAPSALDFNVADGWIWKDKNWNAHRGNLAASAIATNPLDFGSPTPTDPDNVEDPVDESDDNGDGGGDPEEETPPPPPRLPRPVFDPAPGTYSIADFPMTVTIANPPAPADGYVTFRVGSSSWSTYSSGITVPANTVIQAKMIAADPAVYLDSSTASGRYKALVDNFSGSSGGGWDQPYGGASMTAEITNGSDASSFAHGETQIDLGGEILDAGVENTVTFRATSFADAAPGQRFELGTLLMHNGTTFNDSEADGVTLNVALNLGTYGALNFAIPFRMENTENSDDRTASADIVELLSLNTGSFITVANLRYDLVLEIESTDAYGEVQGNQFLIYEGATANGKIYGKLIPR